MLRGQHYLEKLQLINNLFAITVIVFVLFVEESHRLLRCVYIILSRFFTFLAHNFCLNFVPSSIT